MTPHADEIVDLVAYRSDVDGIFLRHVLEHNDDWRVILENALDSARSRLVLVLFTPLGEQVRELAYWPEVGVPDLSLPRSEILELLRHHEVQEMRLATATHYGEETVFLVSISR